MQTLETQTGKAQTEVPELERRQYNVGDKVRAGDRRNPRRIDEWIVASSTASLVTLIRPGYINCIIFEQIFDMRPSQLPLRALSHVPIVEGSRSPQDKFAKYKEILGVHA